MHPTRRQVIAAVGTSLVATTVGCLGITQQCPDPEIPPRTEWRAGSRWGEIQVMAHRGCAAQFPENTLYAFKQVSPYVDGIELDVRRCGSGEIVVFHDETLNRMTTCTGDVSQTSYDALDSCSVGCTEQGVPLLTDAFEAIPADVEVNVEVKTTGMGEEIAEVASEVEHEVLISSFLPDVLSEVRKVNPSVRLALVTDQRLRDSFALARELDCSAIHPRYDLANLASTVEDAHNEDMRVNVWTIDDGFGFGLAMKADVDGVLVDRLDVFDAGKSSGDF